MDDEHLRFVIERAQTDVVEAAFANQTFLAEIVMALVANGALSAGQVGLAMNRERAVIETLRPSGDGYLRAIAHETLVERLRDRFAEQRRTFPPLAEWTHDPQEPHWPLPFGPDDPEG